MSFGDMSRVLALAAALDRVVRGRVDRFIVARRSPLAAPPPAALALSAGAPQQ